MLKLERTRTEYAVEVSIDAFLAVSKWEDWTNRELTLLDKLDKLPGVDNIEYNGHFGPCFYFRLDVDHDTPAMHARIARTIEQHVAKCVRHMARAAA
jgi:hypothetical protein